MKNSPLLPNRFKTIGWILIIPSAIIGIILLITDYRPEWLTVHWGWPLASNENAGLFTNGQTNLANTIVGALFILGGLLLILSKEKQEDEYIANIRLSSLLWAVVVNYVLLLLAFLLIYDLNFINVMIYNMFTVLLIFIIRFEYLMYRAKKGIS